MQWARARRQPMTIRLVKGAYWDSEQIWANQRNWPVPVHTDKRKTDAQFERMTYRLLQESDLIRTAVASHNVRSLAWAMALREKMGIPQHRFEFQLLYGMAGTLPAALVGMGYSPRIYVPVGELIPGMAYLVRRILENTSNDSFIRKFFYQSVSPEGLLNDPKQEDGNE